MDIIVKRNIDQLVAELKKNGQNVSDPVARLMVTALVHQAQKVADLVEQIPEKVVERLCSYFIPRDKVNAIPALCLVQLIGKMGKDAPPQNLSSGTFFGYKIGKLLLHYYPLFANLVIPYSRLHLFTPHTFISGENKVEIKHGKGGQVWIGLETISEIDTFCNVSFFIKGTHGVLPEKIFVGNGTVELSFTTATQIDDLPMLEPFDAQQSSHTFFDVLQVWRNSLSDLDDGCLVYITSKLLDGDVLSATAYPKVFQQSLESRDLDAFANNTLWVLFDFGSNYDVPTEIEIIPNVVPVVNVSHNSVTLTQSASIVKLSRDDGSYFLSVVETSTSAQKQGFGMIEDEVVIRDFDANSYNSDLLFKDIRNLYNRFVDDYYAFVDYYGLKDGKLVTSLRDKVNQVAKSVLDHTGNKYEDGVYAMYAMRDVNTSAQPSLIKVSYLTTFGQLGNTPKVGEMMENKKDSAIEKNVKIVSSGVCGEDKASADHRYELLRYYTLTSDRLFTKMDVDAFVRLQLIKEFGKEEFKRISYSVNIHGASGSPVLRRGLYIDISFKDRKNYDKAMSAAFDRKLKQQIINKSCISMPICVTLINEE